jgi:hypothetical protein
MGEYRQQGLSAKVILAGLPAGSRKYLGELPGID